MLIVLPLITILTVSQCNLTGFYGGDMFYYKADEMIACYNTVPVDVGVVSEATMAAREMIEFYEDTYNNNSSDHSIIGKADLKQSIIAYTYKKWNSDYIFHKSMAKLFLKQQDPNTVYIIPKGYHALYTLPFTLGSRIESGEQVLYIRELHTIFNRVSKNQPWAVLKAGDIIDEINGFPAVRYLAALLDENGLSKSKGTELNHYLNNYRESFGLGLNILGFEMKLFNLTLSGGSVFSIPLYVGKNIPSVTTGNVLSSNAYSSGNSHKSLSDYLYGNQTSSENQLWSHGKVLSQYPNGSSNPTVVCSSFENFNKSVMYLYVESFIPKATTDACGSIESNFNFLKVVEKCNAYGASHSPRISELILDVRSNHGGNMWLYNTVLDFLSPRLWLPEELRDISKRVPRFRIDPPSAAWTKGTFEYSFTNYSLVFIDSYISTIIDSQAYNVVYSDTGENMYDESLRKSNPKEASQKLKELIMSRLTKRSRAAGSPEVWVAPKINILWETLEGLKSAATTCGISESEMPRKPTKGFHTAKILSLGECAGACSEAVKILARSDIATMFTAGGIKGQPHRVTTSASSPVKLWNDWVKEVSDTGILKPIKKTNAVMAFGLAVFLTKPNDENLGESGPLYADYVLPYWPPFSSETELSMFNEMAATPIDSNTGWAEYEIGMLKPSGSVYIIAPDSNNEIFNLVLAIGFPSVIVAIIVTVCCMIYCSKGPGQSIRVVDRKEKLYATCY